MALDQQRNWDIDMADNLAQINRKAAALSLALVPPPPSEPEKPTREWHGPPIYLPDEVLLNILDHILYFRSATEAQLALGACCRLSNQWYIATVPLLYRRPRLYGKNFDPFARTICPSINARVRKSPLSGLVKELDMSRLVHQGSKSLTARLLGRMKNNLESFIAPVASFSIACLAPLSKCQKLRHLDLSLVSESPPLPILFHKTVLLKNLVSFRLPRSSGFGVHFKKSEFPEPWPPKLEELSLSGGIDDHFQHGVVGLPSGLRKLTIEHCPQLKSYALRHLLRKAVVQLEHLTFFKIRYVPRLSSHALDGILSMLPRLHTLSLSADYVTKALFDDTHYNHIPLQATTRDSMSDDSDDLALPAQSSAPFQHAHLFHFELTSSGSTDHDDALMPADLLNALDAQTLPALRQLRISRLLQWNEPEHEEALEELTALLQEAAREDWEKRESVFASMSEARYRKKEIWERVSGVWTFDDTSR